MAIVVVGVAVVYVPVLDGATLGALIVLAPMVLTAAYAPASPAPAAVVLTSALLAALAGDDPLRAEVLVLIPLVHLFHVTCALASLLPHDGRVHIRALRPSAVRFCVVQAAVFGLVGLAALLPASTVPAAVEVVALLGLTAVAGLVIVTYRQR